MKWAGYSPALLYFTRWGAADRGEYRQAAGAIAQAV